MIMKQSEDRWRVFRPCYAQGNMKGKAVEYWKDIGRCPYDDPATLGVQTGVFFSYTYINTHWNHNC